MLPKQKFLDVCNAVVILNRNAHIRLVNRVPKKTRVKISHFLIYY